MNCGWLVGSTGDLWHNKLQLNKISDTDVDIFFLPIQKPNNATLYELSFMLDLSLSLKKTVENQKGRKKKI